MRSNFMTSKKASATLLNKGDCTIIIIAIFLAIAICTIIARNIIYSGAKGTEPALAEACVTRRLYTGAPKVISDSYIATTYEGKVAGQLEENKKLLALQDYEMMKVVQMTEIKSMAAAAAVRMSEAQPVTENEGTPIYTQLGLSEYEYNVLCKTIWHEYGAGCIEGQAAIVEVILNRVNSEYFPNDIVSVIGQEGQFSQKYIVAPFVEPTEEMIEAIKLAFDGSTFSKGALYYSNLNLIEDNEVKAWFLSLERCAEFPGSSFFK